ncbi:MAG: PH domain-containing protein [Candidatus Omnitrophota bacterium]
MYESMKDLLLDLFRAPKGPPDPPAGTHASIAVFRASPQYLTYQYLILLVGMFLLSVFFGFAGIAFLMKEASLGILLCLILVILWSAIGVGGYFLIRLEYDMRYYIVSDRSLRIRTGVWNIMEQTLTFANIQNIQVQQGPLERVLGISRVVVETAGGGSVAAPNGGQTTNYHRASLSGLENAESIRDLILSYLKKLPHSTGLGEPDDRQAPVSAAGRGFTPQDAEALREILSEVKILRSTLLRPPANG